MKLTRGMPSLGLGTPSSPGMWETLDGRFTFSCLTSRPNYPDWVPRGWLLGAHAESDEIWLFKVGLLQERFKTRKAAVAALEEALAAKS
jgi:hypothetical protein